MTPAVSLLPLKCNKQAEVTVNGVRFDRNTTFGLNSQAYDKILLGDDAGQFNPERWFKESVEKRKGTKEELLDHPMFREPFSQGARRCPGSRVATNEVLCLISQLVSKYKIVAAESSLSEVKYEYRLVVQPCIPKLEFIPR